VQLQFSGTLKGFKPKGGKGRIVEVSLEAHADRAMTGELFDMIGSEVVVSLSEAQPPLDGTKVCVTCGGTFIPVGDELHCPNCADHTREESPAKEL
jgi:hypothetical protein